MRMQSRPFLYILAVLMVLFSSGVIANAYELVDIEIPHGRMFTETMHYLSI